MAVGLQAPAVEKGRPNALRDPGFVMRWAAHEQLFSAVLFPRSFRSVNPGCISDPERSNRRDGTSHGLSSSLSLSPSRHVRQHTSLQVR